MTSAAIRRSPLADWHAPRTREWLVREGMPMPLHYQDTLAPDAPVMLCDVSFHRRFGCKGPEAGPWLASQGLDVPQPANSWNVDPHGILVARLATSEFLVEALGIVQQKVESLRLSFPVPHVYPVIRQDAAFTLAGSRAGDLLRETCSFNFADPLVYGHATTGSVVMTSMVGVGVTVVARNAGAGQEYRLWCDPSFGPYLWATLVGIAEEMGGGAVVGVQL